MRRFFSRMKERILNSNIFWLNFPWNTLSESVEFYLCKSDQLDWHSSLKTGCRMSDRNQLSWCRGGGRGGGREEEGCWLCSECWEAADEPDLAESCRNCHPQSPELQILEFCTLWTIIEIKIKLINTNKIRHIEHWTRSSLYLNTLLCSWATSLTYSGLMSR